MSLALIHSRAQDGMQAPPVTVEVHLGGGLPTIAVVGLPDTEVKEARDRVRAALATSQFEFPQRRITVNLAPADLPKESGRFDLPIAIGILAASDQLRSPQLGRIELAGELSLSGELRPIRGALAMACQAAANGRSLILPAANAAEAALARGATVLAARSLLEVVAHLNGHASLPVVARTEPLSATSYPDLAEVRGQQPAKRMLEIAAAGGHSVLMYGPPGSGKSMLACRLPGLLPELDEAQALEAAAIHSLEGEFRAERFYQRAFRAPHHSASMPALVGGGVRPRPGEISLAHHGVLFLDELPEYDRRVLEALREPLETGRITISRAARRLDFPACFQLIAAMNPCPCGYLGHPRRPCRCTPDQVARYRAKLSGPLLDRIDMALEVPAVPPALMQTASNGEPSAQVRMRVSHARDIQQARQGKPNALLAPAEIDLHCPLDEQARSLLQQACERMALSARAYHRILKVARSIADLSGESGVGVRHIGEALQYRQGLPDTSCAK